MTDSTPTSKPLQSFMVPGSGYGYTGLQIDDLQSFENTIAIGLMDESGSIHGFEKAMEGCVKSIVKSLQHCPRKDNLIYRHCHFSTGFREVHGFLPLSQINESMYDGCMQAGGRTSLYDSNDRIVRELLDYSEQQAAKHFTVNGIIYVTTDGCDWGSSLTVSDVRAALAKAAQSETLESLISILIGVNDDPGVLAKLDEYHANAGFTQYIPLKDASEKTLARLGNFISQSISAQSQALGTGGPSQSLVF